MYIVTVINLRSGFTEIVESFPFGEFQEIGFVLDDQGFNTSDYKVEIKFHECGKEKNKACLCS